MIAWLPNALTIGRMAALAPVTALLMAPGPAARWAALALFAAAALSDGLDGWLARRLDARSALGRILDPIADKVLVCGVIVVLGAAGEAPVAAVLVIVAREFLVAGLREALAAQRIEVRVTPFSKAKTVLQMAAIVIVLLPLPQTALAGEAAMWLAALATAVSGVLHWRAGWRALTAHRRSLSGKT